MLFSAKILRRRREKNKRSTQKLHIDKEGQKKLFNRVKTLDVVGEFMINVNEEYSGIEKSLKKLFAKGYSVYYHPAPTEYARFLVSLDPKPDAQECGFEPMFRYAEEDYHD
jgi:hypothetical protein